MWYIYKMGYYSAIKRKKECHLQATWMQLEILILSKSERERQIAYDITYIWNLKYDTNEPIYETETESRTLRTDWWLPRGREGLGVWD